MKTIEDRLSALIPQSTLELQAYQVQDASEFIKLDAMENPYHLPEEIQRAMATALQGVSINRYPDPDCKQLKNAITHLWNLPEDLQILLGNGSDELIQLICLALAHDQAKVIAPHPSFVMYKMIAKFCRLDFQAVPLNSEFALDGPAMLTAVQQCPRSIIFLAYPNNPTGTLFDEKVIRQIIEASQGLVIIDEAYYSFAQTSLIHLATEYDNVLLMRTFSKMGMAGLRLGILLGKGPWIEQLNKIRLPYNINILTQIAAHSVLAHWTEIQSQMESIISQRQLLQEQLSSIEGIVALHSYANFILFQPKTVSAQACFQGLKKQGILIKALGGDMDSYLRVTIGTPEENLKFIHALQQLM